MATAERYPLSWPHGWKRTPSESRNHARFGTRQNGAGSHKGLSVYGAMGRLTLETQRLRATDIILSTNVSTRLDGAPRSNAVEPQDVGAALYFKLRGKDLSLACDRWTRVADNIAAISEHIKALRAIERYGIGTVEQAFAGYAALPPSHEDWWLVLGVERSAEPDVVRSAWRKLSQQHHPDRGGDPGMMSKVNKAYEMYEGREVNGIIERG